MSELLVIVPVLARPHRVHPTIRSIFQTAADAEILFVADPDDAVELDTCNRASAEYAPNVSTLVHAGNYASKINAAVRATAGGRRHIFFGADDLKWSHGWYSAAAAHLDGGRQVVGVNDLCSRRSREGRHATHFLVTRNYATAATIDATPGPLYEGYDHSCCDDEFLEVAMHRGVAVVDPSIVVEHLHPDAGKAPTDATYEKGRARIRDDRKILHARRHLWT